MDETKNLFDGKAGACAQPSDTAVPAHSADKADIASMEPAEIAAFLAALSEKSGVKIEKFRAGQIFSWLTKGVRDFDEMANVPARIRAVLRENAYLTLPSVKIKLVSKIDGTVKYLFELSEQAERGLAHQA